MKQLIIICSSIVLLLQNAIAQPDAHKGIDSANIENLLSKAKCYLQGSLCPPDAVKAFQLNMQCANAGSAKAMNAVAIQYQKGLGVDSNNVEAVKWFTKAAEAGYNTAWYNLALHYKYDNPVDFTKAYQCFAKAANAGHLGGYYGQAYMLYKGLGVHQDYKKAAALFQAGAYAGDAPCMYYFGLVLRNGYGVTANQDSAKYWLEKAMALGYTRSQNELRSKGAEVNGESSNISERIEEAKRKLLPGSNDEIVKYKKVDHVVATNHNIPGLWEGYILKYDWSGKHVISAGKLSLQLNCKDTLVTGLWLEDDTLQVAVNATLNKRGLTFCDMQYKRASHYTNGKTTPLQFDRAALRLVQKKDTVYLVGNLQQTATDAKEPARPMSLVLTRSEMVTTESVLQAKTSGLEANQSSIQKWPNPFQNNLNVQFELTKDGSVQMSVRNALGQLVYNGNQMHLQAGKHIILLQLSLAAGTYVLSVTHDQTVSSTIIIKQ